MSLAKSTDEKWLAVGTEKGEVIIWSNAGHRIEKRFDQGSPVHSLSFLGDNRYVIAAGGPHTGDAQGCVVRKWDLVSGEFKEFAGCGTDSVFYLATDDKSGLIAASSGFGAISVWNSLTAKLVYSLRTGQATLGMAFANRKIYAAEVDPSVLKANSDDTLWPSQIVTHSIDSTKDNAPVILAPKSGRLVSGLDTSPDGKYLVAGSYDEDSGYRVLLLDAINGAERAAFTAELAAFGGNSELLLFANDEPAQRIHIDVDGKTTEQDFGEGGRFHQAGNPTKMMGGAASSDMKRAWAVFQLNGSLLEYDLEEKKATALIVSYSVPYAMEVLEMPNGNGWLVSGGDDGFIRVWALKDLSLKREFHVPTGWPESVALLADGDQVVFSSSAKESPTEIVVSRITTGKQKKLLSVPQPFVVARAASRDILYNVGNKIVLASAETGTTIREFRVDERVSIFAVSANGNWLAVADMKGNLSLFKTPTGEGRSWLGAKIDSPSNIAVTNDGHFVYTTEWMAHIRRWDTLKQTTTDLGTIRGQAHCLRLSVDERSMVIGGNHRDIGIYDATSGKQLFYTRTDATDFYVTNGWLKGTRLIFTTDGGVMFDGSLER